MAEHPREGELGVKDNGGPSTRPKVVIALDHPAQQFVASFRRASRSTLIDLEVLYSDAHLHGHHDINFGRDIRWDVDLHKGYHWRVPTRTRLGRAVSTWRSLSSMRPAVVLCFGWGTTISRLSFLWATATSTPVLIYGDSTWQSSQETCHGALRSIILRILFLLSDGAISTGTFNREFYILHGMHPRRIHPGVCPVDLDSFRMARQPQSCEEDVHVGFAGKLIARKGASELVDALALLKDTRGWRAHLIGDGPLRSDLIAQVARLGLSDRVEFAGFINTAGMPHALAACDVLVVPSRRDLRVLVAAEAMAAGCVVVVSSHTAVWGAGDLVEDGITGRVYAGGDPTELATVLRDLIASPELRERLRTAGMKRAELFGPATFTTTLEHAIARTLAS